MTQLEKFIFHLPYSPKFGVEYNSLSRIWQNILEFEPAYLSFAFIGFEKEKKYIDDNYKKLNLFQKSNFYAIENDRILLGELESSIGICFDDVYLDEVKPYFRSFDQLTKECVQADYNDGKPFIPIEELALLDYDLYSLHYISVHTKRLPFEIVQQLLKWHFAIGFEQGEYIEVTNENNPY